MAANLNLRKFDISSVGKGNIIVAIGRRNSGKSFFVRDLLYYKRDIPIGTVISATESANSFYSEMMPALFIHEDYNPEIIANLVKRQKIVTKKMKQQIAMYGKSNIDPYAFLVLDDLMYDSKRWMVDTSIKEIFMNGRHFNLMFLITMQYSLGINPSFRGNVDIIVIYKENMTSNRKRLYEHYAGMFPTFEIFCQVMDQCTENYECIVIDTRTKSNKIEDQVFWYKAEPHESFKIGAPEFWQHHTNNYCEQDEEDNNDINKLHKKNQIPINVKKTF